VPKDVIDTVKSRTTIATAALAGALASPAGAQTHVHALLHPTIGGQTVRAQLHRAGHAALVRRDARLAHAVRRLGGEAPSRHALNRMSSRALRRLHVRLARDRHELKTAPPVSGTLQAIAACESGGDPHAIGGGGAFRGKYQFTRETWAAMGGSGDPAAAPEAQQDRLAAKLYATAGAGQWPVCGR
jgi:Transglycosylase-like domain